MFSNESVKVLRLSVFVTSTLSLPERMDSRFPYLAKLLYIIILLFKKLMMMMSHINDFFVNSIQIWCTESFNSNQTISSATEYPNLIYQNTRRKKHMCHQIIPSLFVITSNYQEALMVPVSGRIISWLSILVSRFDKDYT